MTINAMSKQLPALGLDIEALHRINPRLILCHLDAFGGPGDGARSNHPGYDDLVQASTGIMERFGGSMETVEEHAHFGTIDVLGGLSAAFAVSLALRRRDQTDRGDVARSSLVAAGQWLQSRFFYDFQDRPPFGEARGRYSKGEAPNYRCYYAADGWFFFAMRPDAFDRLVHSGVITGLAQVDVDRREAFLEAAFAQEALPAWRDKLEGFDAALQPLESLSGVRRAMISKSPDQNTIVFRHERDHPSGRAVQHVEPTAIRPLRAPIVRTGSFEKYGNSTTPLMRELGSTEAAITEFSAAGCDRATPGPGTTCQTETGHAPVAFPKPTQSGSTPAAPAPPAAPRSRPKAVIIAASFVSCVTSTIGTASPGDRPCCSIDCNDTPASRSTAVTSRDHTRPVQHHQPQVIRTHMRGHRQCRQRLQGKALGAPDRRQPSARDVDEVGHHSRRGRSRPGAAPHQHDAAPRNSPPPPRR